MTARPIKIVRCLMPSCTNTTTTSGYRPKRCPACLRRKWRQESAVKHLRLTGRLRPPREDAPESPASIEARFNAALKEARRTVREELWHWSSPLAGLK